MKCLLISTLFPPDMLGGAEFACCELAKWLAEEGHEVHVLTTAKAWDEQQEGEGINGLSMWRVSMPRPYPALLHPSNGGVKKLIWHLQDHFDPRNESLVDSILDKSNLTWSISIAFRDWENNVRGLLAQQGDSPVVLLLCMILA